MFKKVLIAEDINSINHGVRSVLSKLGASEIHHVQYCDDALLKIKKGIYDQAPFELLITDLSFVADHRKQELKSGEDLIKQVKKHYPNLKIIVYTIDNRLHKVRGLFLQDGIDAYICKGRNDMKELATAIEAVGNNNTYLSMEVTNALDSKFDLEINEYDIELMKQLSLGLGQSEISKNFLDKKITPNSLSSIEKRINKLKDQFRAGNTTHLVSIVKDLGLI